MESSQEVAASSEENCVSDERRSLSQKHRIKYEGQADSEITMVYMWIFDHFGIVQRKSDVAFRFSNVRGLLKFFEYVPVYCYMSAGLYILVLYMYTLYIMEEKN